MLYKNDEMVHHETIFGLESTQLKFGRNSLNELGWELSKYNSKKILLVVDPVLHDFDVTQKILDQIKLSGAEVTTFDNISVEPTLESFEIASQFALENSFDLIIAAGGGSTLDTAKVINLIKVCGRESYGLCQCSYWKRKKAYFSTPSINCHTYNFRLRI